MPRKYTRKINTNPVHKEKETGQRLLSFDVRDKIQTIYRKHKLQSKLNLGAHVASLEFMDKRGWVLQNRVATHGVRRGEGKGLTRKNQKLVMQARGRR